VAVLAKVYEGLVCECNCSRHKTFEIQSYRNQPFRAQSKLVVLTVTGGWVTHPVGCSGTPVGTNKEKTPCEHTAHNSVVCNTEIIKHPTPSEQPATHNTSSLVECHQVFSKHDKYTETSNCMF
jgi:hypothetical protein